MLRIDAGRPKAANYGRWAPLGWRLFVALWLLSLVACTPGWSVSSNVPAIEPRLYVMMSTEVGWALAAADIATGTLTPLLEGVSGFTPALEGFVVVLDGGRTLARWDREHIYSLRDCAGECRDPVLSADGKTLAWIEEVEGKIEGWVLGLADESAMPLGVLSSRPVWNPTGEQLAAISPEGVVLWSAAGERLASLDLSLLAAPPSWTPAGDRLTVIMPAGAAVSLEPRLLTLDSQMALLQPLAADQVLAQISEVAWSPTGEQVALLRRRFFPPEEAHADGEANTFHEESSGADALGPQPWLFAMDGGAFIPLPGDVGAGFARPVWSADGRWLAAVRLPMGIPDPRPEVWVWDAVTGRLLQQFPGTAAPVWAEH
ncbi:MAG: hypothetical protein JW892_03045 [Anaerolineae bacterium]|nr:hypothetical protein [Anaerolineae bacterium]